MAQSCVEYLTRKDMIDIIHSGFKEIIEPTGNLEKDFQALEQFSEEMALMESVAKEAGYSLDDMVDLRRRDPQAYEVTMGKLEGAWGATKATASMAVVLAKYGSMMMGDMGEQAAGEMCTQHLNMSPSDFSPAKHGFDGVFTDSLGNTVVMESKCWTNPPVSSTGRGQIGKQMSDAWIEKNAGLMKNPSSAQYKDGYNADTGKQILDAMDPNKPGSLRRILVHTNPTTGEIRTYESSDGNYWNEIPEGKGMVRDERR